METSKEMDTAKPEAAVFAHTLLDMSRDAIVTVDMRGIIEYWNAGAEQLFGYRRKQATGRSWDSLFLQEEPESRNAIWQEVLQLGKWEGEISCRHADGQRIVVLSRWDTERDTRGEPTRVVMVSSSQEQYARLLGASTQNSHTSFDELFAHHPDGVFAFNREGRLISANASLEKLTGYTRHELMSMQLEPLVRKSSFELLRQAFLKAMAGDPQTAEFTLVHKDGSEIDASISLLPNIVNHVIVGVHGVVKDISDRKSSERRILYLANHDALTGLPNRNLLYDRMQHAIEQARRYKTMVGVLFMDLNRFKIVNDSLGHDKGDLLLKAVADRLRYSLRDVDTVARLGGDEFVVVLENITDAGHIQQFAHHLLHVICQPVELDGTTLSVSTSIGASLYPQDGDQPYVLLKNADLAMYAAKERGLGKFCLYTPEMNDKALERLGRESRLREAIESRELLLHYQPRLNMHTNQIVAVEALVRWDHPEKGLIYPSYFIELAEEIGLIDALGEWVFTSGCRQMMRWRQAGLKPIKMSINVSAQQLNTEFCHMVAHVLEQTGLEARYIELEITESTLMLNLESTYDILLRLKQMGVSLSIDDFGTGYSSLNYLKRLPIDTLKIDKTFVRDIGEDPDDTAIVNATIAMAHSMELEVVAEGVVTFEQLEFLQNADCDEIQGYLICQPLPADELEGYFKTCELRGIQYSWAS
ncbi:MAG TPA: EAL domain-containing protein [Methylophilaceae bacterium]|nr:EAL domain-containing protein [Methylophilaceae bacterium]